jgi:hypothetical protein
VRECRFARAGRCHSVERRLFFDLRSPRTRRIDPVETSGRRERSLLHIARRSDIDLIDSALAYDLAPDCQCLIRAVWSRLVERGKFRQIGYGRPDSVAGGNGAGLGDQQQLQLDCKLPNCPSSCSVTPARFRTPRKETGYLRAEGKGFALSRRSSSGSVLNHGLPATENKKRGISLMESGCN